MSESAGTRDVGAELRKLSEELGTRIDKWVEENIIPANAQPPELYRYARDSVQGGKGLRELAVYIGTEALGKDPEKTIPFGAALKLGQAALIIMDDINDDSFFRRGGLCLHRKVGITEAQLIYSELLVKSYRCLTTGKTVWGESTTDKLLDLWNQMLEGTGDGQYMEHMKKRSRDFLSWNEKEYFDNATEKAGDYTLGAPLAAAGIIAGVLNGVATDLRTIGRMAGGTVFQPIDDVLNLEYLFSIDQQLLKGKRVSDLVNFDGETLSKILGRYGKEPGGDILEGKETLSAIHYLQQIKDSQSELEGFKKVYGIRDSLYDDVFELFYKMKDKGSIQYARTRANEQKEKIIALIPEKFKDASGTQKLLDLIEFAYSRTS